MSFSSKEKNKKDRKAIPALCNILGILIFLSVIAFYTPIALQGVGGYQIYNVVSGSMEPEIPIGSAICVFPIDPEDVASNDIIAFESNDSVVTHRVVTNQVIEGTFVTKGDFNEGEDPVPIPYNRLIGKVTFHISRLGTVMDFLTTLVGKLYVVLYLACGVLFQLLAHQLRLNRKARRTMSDYTN